MWTKIGHLRSQFSTHFGSSLQA
ncbi:hypothetical protein F383_17161 [Gossypium arboreum]|uniref:Uncharacterized protein n=1 Tax=Gossypium arboreum TaxID=29729 RepID=A0A0B0NI16_GOSAR|nr:hypothetical protein F383_17161 [Gossypium arboreum]